MLATMSPKEQESIWLKKGMKFSKELKTVGLIYFPEYNLGSITDVRMFWHTEAHHQNPEFADKVNMYVCVCLFLMLFVYEAALKCPQ